MGARYEDGHGGGEKKQPPANATNANTPPESKNNQARSQAFLGPAVPSPSQRPRITRTLFPVPAIFCSECRAELDSTNPTRELSLSFCYVCATMYAVVRRSKGLYQEHLREMEERKKQGNK